MDVYLRGQCGRLPWGAMWTFTLGGNVDVYLGGQCGRLPWGAMWTFTLGSNVDVHTHTHYSLVNQFLCVLNFCGWIRFKMEIFPIYSI